MAGCGTALKPLPFDGIRYRSQSKSVCSAPFLCRHTLMFRVLSGSLGGSDQLMLVGMLICIITVVAVIYERNVGHGWVTFGLN